MFAIVAAFRSGPLENFASVANPVGFISPDLAAAAIAPVSLGLALGIMIPAASLVVFRYKSIRCRSASGTITTARLASGSRRVFTTVPCTVPPSRATTISSESRTGPAR